MAAKGALEWFGTSKAGLFFRYEISNFFLDLKNFVKRVRIQE